MLQNEQTQAQYCLTTNAKKKHSSNNAHKAFSISFQQEEDELVSDQENGFLQNNQTSQPSTGNLGGSQGNSSSNNNKSNLGYRLSAKTINFLRKFGRENS